MAIQKIKQMEEKLDIEPLPPLEVKRININFSEDCHDDIHEDYKILRERLINSIAVGETVLEVATNDLQNNLSARTIEACSTILKTIVDSSEKVLNLHEKMLKFIPKEPKEAKETDKKTVTANINDILDNC